MVRRVYVIMTDTAGCYWYRLHTPLRALNPEEFQVYWQPPPAGNRLPGDVVIGQRIAGENSAWMEMCADPDLLAVYDLDDDLLNIDPENAVPYSIYKDQVESTQDNIAAADVVTVSSQKLADLVCQINPEVVVLPNCLREEWLRTPILGNGGPITVGWAGSMFHRQDWPSEVNQQLAWIRATDTRFQFHMIGADYTNGILGARVSGWSTMETYNNTLDFDIGLGVLNNTPFNQRKSWIKALEYMGKGIVPVMPYIGQYPQLIEHGVNGYLYRNLDMLHTYLEDLRDDRARYNMACSARLTAEDWLIDAQVDRWERVYRGDWNGPA